VADPFNIEACTTIHLRFLGQPRWPARTTAMQDKTIIDPSSQLADGAVAECIERLWPSPK